MEAVGASWDLNGRAPIGNFAVKKYMFEKLYSRISLRSIKNLIDLLKLCSEMMLLLRELL